MGRHGQSFFRIERYSLFVFKTFGVDALLDESFPKLMIFSGGKRYEAFPVASDTRHGGIIRPKKRSDP